jgi:HEAT repeat protein
MCKNDSRMVPFVCLMLLGAQEGSNPDLLRELRGKTTRGRLDAMKTMVEYASAVDRATMRALVDLANDSDPKIRKAALQTIGEIGPKARERGGGPKLGEALAKLFHDTDPVVRRAAVWAYGQTGIDTREELDVLAAVLKDKSPELRFFALKSLGEYMHEATPKEWRRAMEEEIAELLADSNARVQEEAAAQLLAAGPETMPTLVRMLDNPKNNARVWAAVVLGELGPTALPAFAAIRGVLGDVAPKYRPYVQGALRKIMP